MDSESARKAFELLSARDDLAEVMQVYEFTAVRRGRDGTDREVTIRLHDSGPAAGATRYWTVVTDEDGRSATGNPSNDLYVALNLVHWGDLDK